MIYYAYAEYRLDNPDMMPEAATLECEVPVRGALILEPAEKGYIFGIDHDKLTNDNLEYLKDAWSNVADIWLYATFEDAMNDEETAFEPNWNRG